jgi:predicted outer membrane protein
MLNSKQVSQLRLVALSSALAMGGALTACKGKEAATTDTTAATAMAPTDTSMNAMANTAAVTDSTIAALVDEVNVADSTLAAAALPNLTNSGAKDFAKLMMGEHHSMHVAGLQVETSQHITPALPTNDPFKPAVQAEQSALASASKGAAYDSTYIANEVGIHQAVLDWLGNHPPQNDAYKSYIADSGPTIQKHLDKAKALQGTLSHT